MSTYSNTAREVEMPNGDVVVLHSAPTGGANTTSNIKKFKYDDNGHVTESEAANATDLNLNSYSTPTTGSTAIGTSDAVQTAIGKLDHQSQIDQSNILYNLNTGVKNELDNFGTTSYESSGVTFTFNEDGSVRIKGTATGGNAVFYYYTGGYSYISNIYKDHILSGVTGGAEETYGLLAQYSSNGTSWATQEMCKTAPITIKSDYNYINICIIVFSGQTVDTTIYPMLCTPEAWAQSHDFMPPALPNYDLTRLEAEDRASLAEVVDSGAKNLINLDSCTITSAYPALTIVARNGNEVTVSCDGTQTTPISIDITGISVPTNQFLILSGCASGGDDDGFQLDAYNNGALLADSVDTGNGSNPFKFTTMTNSKIRIRVAANASFTNKVFKIMLCTKAAFGVSNKSVPYRPSYQDLVNATKIEVLTSSDIFTPNTNYTVINDGAIYKQGKHIFGNLIVSKSDGDFNSVEANIGQIKTGYQPAKLYIGNGTTFNTSQWGVNGIGYCYISASNATTPSVIVKTSSDGANKFSIVIIRLDYCTP